MASEPSLSSRRSLVWETREISKYQKESPVFSLMDSNWILQVNPIYEIGKFCATSYSIKLKNCCGIQSFKPFEVVTFLEDRRYNVRVRCSKLTVSSPHETLFKTCFNSTYEKIPSLKIYDDVAIVCTFYPSTGLALSAQIIRGSNLRIRHSVVWKTRKPSMYQRREESPLFNLKNLKWKLEVYLTSSTQNHMAAYHICLKNSNGTQSPQPFEIETYLFDKKSYENIWCSRLTVSSTFEILYKANDDEIYKKLPGLKFVDDITIVCSFGPPIGLALSEKMENDITVSMECQCTQYQNRGSFSQDNAEKCFPPIASAPLKFLSDFENLSKDFSFLLDNSFMTDIQLECGETVLSAHKAILAARSPVFSTALKHEIVERSDITVEIEDMEHLLLREFLGYLYRGKIPVELSEDMLCKLYTTGERYSVSSLTKLCSCSLTRNLNAQNFIKFLILADKHNDLELMLSITGFITERPELLTSAEWIEFSDEFPKLANEVYRKHMVNVLKNKFS